MSTVFSGVVTPIGYTAGLMEAIATQSVIGRESDLASLLSELAPKIEAFGYRDLSARLESSAKLLRNGGMRRADWLHHPLNLELERMGGRLAGGEPAEDVFSGGRAAEELAEVVQGGRRGRATPALRSVRDKGSAIGPPPEIQWEQFGTPKHPGPMQPSEDVVTAGQRFAFMFSYVAGWAGAGDTAAGTEKFYGISDDMRHRIEKGKFVPKNFGSFPSEIAGALLLQAHGVEPLYGQLLQELLIHAMFESYGWSLGLPLPEASWDIHFVYGLRRYLCQLLMTPAGKERALEDRALQRVADGKNSLEEVRWHPRQTRREVFERWLQGMTAGNIERWEALRRFLGEKILELIGWRSPRNGADWGQQVQWAVRRFVAGYHYGALPARGLPFATDLIIRFVMARDVRRVDPKFAKGLVMMMGAYLSSAESEYLNGIIPAANGGD